MTWETPAQKQARMYEEALGKQARERQQALSTDRYPCCGEHHADGPPRSLLETPRRHLADRSSRPGSARMTVIHILSVPTRVYSQRPDGEPRWCFVCRKRMSFTLTVHTPIDDMSYYGPHATIECESGHVDGDCFPGWYRDWPE